MNDTDPHWERRQAILSKFPDVRRLIRPDIRTLWYIGAVIAIQVGLSIAVRDSLAAAVVLGITIGPILDMGVLVIMHELSHNRCTGNIVIDRLLAITSNTLMLAPIAEIFRQHHGMHHYHLGHEDNDVDVPYDVEIKFVGNSSVRKFCWLFFNMVILPIRSLYKLEVKTSKFLVINWIACLGIATVVFFVSTNVFVYLALSLFFSQGLHPANARQLQRHLWDGSDAKECNTVGNDPQTFSYYGWINAISLNVGYEPQSYRSVQL
jgi:sphingolipid delta-4 desaturase